MLSFTTRRDGPVVVRQTLDEVNTRVRRRYRHALGRSASRSRRAPGRSANSTSTKLATTASLRIHGALLVERELAGTAFDRCPGRARRTCPTASPASSTGSRPELTTAAGRPHPRRGTAFRDQVDTRVRHRDGCASGRSAGSPSTELATTASLRRAFVARSRSSAGTAVAIAAAVELAARAPRPARLPPPGRHQLPLHHGQRPPPRP